MKILIASVNRDIVPLEIEVDENATVGALKQKVMERLCATVSTPREGYELKLWYQMRPIRMGDPTYENLLLFDYNIKEGSILTGELWRSERIW